MNEHKIRALPHVPSAPAHRANYHRRGRHTKKFHIDKTATVKIHPSFQEL
jgi:hypothetical protein